MLFRSSCRSSEEAAEPKAAKVSLETTNNNNNTSAGSADLLGLGLGGVDIAPVNNMNGNGFSQESTVNNLNK